MPQVREWPRMVRGERHSLKVRENNNLCAFERSHKMSSKLDLVHSNHLLLASIFTKVAICNISVLQSQVGLRVKLYFFFFLLSLFSNIYLMLKMWEVLNAFHRVGFFFRIGRILLVKSNCTTSCFWVCKKINPSPHYIKGLSLHQFIYTVCGLLIAH